MLLFAGPLPRFGGGGSEPTAAGNSYRKGVDAMSGVNEEVVLASPKACPADVYIVVVAGEVVNIVIIMASIHKIHSYL